MTIENMTLRIQQGAYEGPAAFKAAVKDALRRYTEAEVAFVIGAEALEGVLGHIAGDEGCNGLCISGAEVGVPEFPGIAYPHPDCPEHGR